MHNIIIISMAVEIDEVARLVNPNYVLVEGAGAFDGHNAACIAVLRLTRVSSTHALAAAIIPK